MRTRKTYCLLFLLVLGLLPALGQDVTLTARVVLVDAQHADRPPKPGNVVLWLRPVEGGDAPMPPPVHPQLAQRNKTFEPHLLVVPVGTVVQFPNRDPFFHNVFSLFEGRRFDLGLYEAGSSRDVHFDKPGISYIFCNIHPNMSAVIIALDTPYYGISNNRGEVVIPNVPAGRYALHTWYEEALPTTLQSLTREIVVSANNSTLGVLRLAVASVPENHKNKYGRDYDNPSPADSPAYARP